MHNLKETYNITTLSSVHINWGWDMLRYLNELLLTTVMPKPFFFCLQYFQAELLAYTSFMVQKVDSRYSDHFKLDIHNFK